MLSVTTSQCIIVPIVAYCSFVSIPSQTMPVFQASDTFPVHQISCECKSQSDYNNLSFVWEDNALYRQDLYKTIEKIRSFGLFQQGWNGYGAPAFSKSLLNLAESIVKGLDYQPEVFPIAGGAIQLEYEKPTGEYLEFEISETEDTHCFLIDSMGVEHDFDLDCDAEKINKVVREFYE